MVVFSIAQFFDSLKAYISILYNFYAIFVLGVVLISAGMNINIGKMNDVDSMRPMTADLERDEKDSMQGTVRGRDPDLLTMTIKKLYPHRSIGGVTMGIDLVIIPLGWPAFGEVDAVLFGLAATFVTSAIIDKIMYGAEAGTLLIIIPPFELFRIFRVS